MGIPNQPYCSKNPKLDIIWWRSEQCIGLFIKSEKVFCILSFTQSLKAWINANKVHINNLEYIALHLAKLLVQLLYSQNQGKYPPHPCHNANGDNEPSISMLNNSSTALKLGQQQIRLTAEHTFLADVKSTGSHVKGRINKPAYSFSRSYLLSPNLTQTFGTSFSTILLNKCAQSIVSKNPCAFSFQVDG